MNGIFNNKSENHLQGVLAPKSKESVETAGSLAMNVFHSLFEVNSYDEFSTNNPFAVDYSLYADLSDDSVAYCGFLEAFSNAITAIGDGNVSCGTSAVSDCGASSSGFASMC